MTVVFVVTAVLTFTTVTGNRQVGVVVGSRRVILAWFQVFNMAIRRCSSAFAVAAQPLLFLAKFGINLSVAL